MVGFVEFAFSLRIVSGRCSWPAKKTGRPNVCLLSPISNGFTPQLSCSLVSLQDEELLLCFFDDKEEEEGRKC